MSTGDDERFQHIDTWSPFRVDQEGRVTQVFRMYEPEVMHVEGQQAPYDLEVMGSDWEPISGYTGQYAYKGAVMHPAEQFAGRMADDIIKRPGVYVIVEVRDDDGQFSGDTPIGWVLMRYKDPLAGEPHDHDASGGRCKRGEITLLWSQPPCVCDDDAPDFTPSNRRVSSAS